MNISTINIIDNRFRYIILKWNRSKRKESNCSTTICKKEYKTHKEKVCSFWELTDGGQAICLNRIVTDDK